MPELPEVETVRRELAPWLSGRRICGVELVDAVPGAKYANLPKALGQCITAVRRRGKFLILPLDGGDELIIHLGMTGILSPERPAKHLRVQLSLDGDGSTQLYFQDTRRFGRFLVVPAGNYRSLPTLQSLGAEPLSEDFSFASFHQALQRSSVAIKTYLLSQKPVAGVGNIYADEALWQSRIHPLTPSRQLSYAQAEALAQAIQQVLQASIAAQGTTLNDYRTVNGEVGAYLEQLQAYGHTGQPCARCTYPLQRMKIAGRSSHFCPQCQPLP